MSRSTDKETNPCTRWFEWSGSQGKLSYYDKERGEKVFIDLPFTFLVLDQLTTITGWSDEAQSGIWSNEVRSTKTEELVVRTKMGIVATGPYDKVKTVTGAKYAKSIYIAFYDEQKKLQLGNLKASGSCVSAWIEYSRGKDVYKGAVTLEGSVSAKKGATKYFMPVFAAKASVSDETEAAARELDRQLQEYLSGYLHRDEPIEDWQPLANEELETSPFEGKQEEEEYIPF